MNSIPTPHLCARHSPSLILQVDFLNPTINTVRESLRSAWHQLPPPVQQAAPYAGVAVGSGLLVWAIQQRRLNYQVGPVAAAACRAMAPRAM